MLAAALLTAAFWSLPHCLSCWAACCSQALSLLCCLSSEGRRYPASSAVQADFTKDEQEPVTKQLFEDGLGLAGLELLDAGEWMAALSASRICCLCNVQPRLLQLPVPLQASSCWSRTSLTSSHPSRILRLRAFDCIERQR